MKADSSGNSAASQKSQSIGSKLGSFVSKATKPKSSSYGAMDTESDLEG